VKWQLELTCSVWRRERWAGGQQLAGEPDYERMFTALIKNAQDQHEMACAMARLGGQAEEWLRARRVSVVVYVVHVLYTLEISDAAA